MCPRGQFMQMHPEDPGDLWAACGGQEDRKCAERCYARYFSGAPGEQEEDIAYWTGWVARRMRHVREMAELVDVFVAPARYLQRRYHDAFGLPERKLVYLDYGFDLARLRGRAREPGEPFTLGYIGTHIPAKGIHHLIEAFGQVRGDARLRIWGRPRGQDTEALRAMAERLPDSARGRIEWLPEYKNQDIVRDVFNRVDCVVVPSVWVENSPLVIHEALQARVPVITAGSGRGTISRGCSPRLGCASIAWRRPRRFRTCSWGCRRDRGAVEGSGRGGTAAARAGHAPLRRGACNARGALVYWTFVSQPNRMASLALLSFWTAAHESGQSLMISLSM